MTYGMQYIESGNNPPVVDQEVEYDCPTCTYNGLGKHPYSIPPCDPLPRFREYMPSFYEEDFEDVR